jgi:thiol-disulfide isomerase/thioredoxin
MKGALNSYSSLRKAGFLFVVFVLSNCGLSEKTADRFVTMDTDALIEKVSQEPDSLVKVFNFWASWCTPCLKEIPEFEAFAKAHASEVELVFVNLDRQKVWETAVPNAVEELEMTQPIWLIDQGLDFEWRYQVDEGWVLPAIPVTLMIYKSHRKFFMKPLDRKELEEALLELQTL